MNERGYRHFESLVEEGRPLAGLEGELEDYPLNERVELCRYTWGLLDHRYDGEHEAAFWLYAWSLAAEQEKRGVEARVPEPVA
jgi:hypothetical protein